MILSYKSGEFPYTPLSVDVAHLCCPSERFQSTRHGHSRRLSQLSERMVPSKEPNCFIPTADIASHLFSCIIALALFLDHYDSFSRMYRRHNDIICTG